MTKEEQSAIIKDAMVRNLRKDIDIPDSIGKTYAVWVRGKIAQASAQLTQVQGPQDQGQQQEAS